MRRYVARPTSPATVRMFMLVVALGIAIVILFILGLSLLVPLLQNLGSQTSALLACAEDGSCLGGMATFDRVVATGGIFAPNINNGSNASCIANINGVTPTNGSGELYLVAGPNIAITPDPGNSSIDVATTSHVSVTTLAVSQATLLGYSTNCTVPLLPSCLDISGQMCTTPLASDCLPQSATFGTLTVNNLVLANGSALEAVCTALDVLTVQDLDVGTLSLSGPASCTGGALISQDCINLSGYTCPLGQPVTDSCIPANMTFVDATVTNTLMLNLVQCTNGNPLNAATCLPALQGDVTGPLSATVVTALQGTPIASTAPSAGQVFMYGGSNWAPGLTSTPSAEANTIVSRDSAGSSAFDVVSATLIQSSSTESCLQLGNTAGVNPSVCAKNDMSMDYNSIVNVSSIYVDNIFSSGIQALAQGVITLYGNVYLATGNLFFANLTELSAVGTNALTTNGGLTAAGDVTALHFVPANAGGVLPTVAAGTGAGTSPTLTVTAGSTDCKMQVTLTTGGTPSVSAPIFTVTYHTAFNTLTKGIVMSAANAAAAALTSTGRPYVGTETLTGFVLTSNAVGLAASTQYLWNFQTCA